MDGDMVISFGDILFRRYILSSLLDLEDDIAIAVDGEWSQRNGNRLGFQDLVQASSPHSLGYTTEEVWLQKMAPEFADEVQGEWIGLMRCSESGTATIKSAVAQLSEREDFDQLHLFDLFNHLIEQGHKIRVLYITGHWLDVDNLDDLAKAQSFQTA